MRRYSQEQEEKIRAQDWVRQWKRSGFLNPSQAARLESDLSVNLRRTNAFLRVVLFVFTGLIVAASVLLIMTAFDVHNELLQAIILCMAGVACFGCTEYVIARFQVYRFGVEEAFATASVVLFSLGAAIIASEIRSGPPDELLMVGLAVATVSAFGIYRRFGYIYAAVGSLLCATLLPTPSNLSEQTQRIIVAVLIALVFVNVRTKRLKYGDDFPGDEYGILQAFAFADLYFVLNLHLSPNGIQGWFYWMTYVAIWILPAAGLIMSLRKKDRLLLDVSLIMALATLATNKLYLRLPHRAWDPIVFGVFLMMTAAVLRRWLSNGHDGQRYGFTPVRLLGTDERLLSLAGTASAAFQVGVQSPSVSPDTQPRFNPGGGRSGGAGASGSF